MVLFAMPTAVALSQCTGIGGWGCPRSLRVALKIIPSWKFINNAPSSASAADATSHLKIEHNVWNVPFSLMGFPSLGTELMKKWPHAWLRAFSSLKYDRNGCSTPYLMLKILPLHLGVMPSNLGLGMPFLRYVLFRLFAHWQLNSTSLKRSYLPLFHSIWCYRQFSGLVWFLYLWVSVYYLVGGRTVLWRRISLALLCMGSDAPVAWSAHISTIVFDISWHWDIQNLRLVIPTEQDVAV